MRQWPDFVLIISDFDHSFQELTFNQEERLNDHLVGKKLTLAKVTSHFKLPAVL